MRRNRAVGIPAVLLAAIAVIVAAGCERREMVMRYDEHGRLVPELKAGDVIRWKGVPEKNIEWTFFSPCEDNKIDEECKIRAGSGGLFHYTCTGDTPCDPEIVVDSGVVVTGPVALVDPVRQGRTIVAVHFACVENSIVTKPERALRAGDVVSWRAIRHVDPIWTATFADPSAACGSAGPIQSPAGTCTLQASGTFQYQFEVTHDDCGGTRTVTENLMVN